MKALYMLPAQLGAETGSPTSPGDAQGEAATLALAVDLVSRVERLEAAPEGGDREMETGGSVAMGNQGKGRSARDDRRRGGQGADPGSRGAALSGSEPGLDDRPEWPHRPPVSHDDPAARALAERLVAGTLKHLSDVDDVLAAVAQGWPLSHLAAVDRAILRFAAHELLHTDTPAPIVINDAVELARRYSTEESPRFVNGVLGALAPDRENGYRLPRRPYRRRPREDASPGVRQKLREPGDDATERMKGTTVDDREGENGAWKAEPHPMDDPGHGQSPG